MCCGSTSGREERPRWIRNSNPFSNRQVECLTQAYVRTLTHGKNGSASWEGDCGEEPQGVQHRSRHEQDGGGHDKHAAATDRTPSNFMTLKLQHRSSDGEGESVDSYGEPCDY